MLWRRLAPERPRTARDRVAPEAAREEHRGGVRGGRARARGDDEGGSSRRFSRSDRADRFGTRAPPRLRRRTDPDAPRPATRASVEEGRRPVGVGLGGGGGRTREVATPEARARQLRRTNKAAETDEERYEAFVGGSEAEFSSRSLGGTPAGKTNARNALSPTSASAPGSSARARYGEGREASATIPPRWRRRRRSLAAAAARRLPQRRVAAADAGTRGRTPRGGERRRSAHEKSRRVGGAEPTGREPRREFERAGRGRRRRVSRTPGGLYYSQ